MLPEDDLGSKHVKKKEHFKCFDVNFRFLKIIYVHLLVCQLNKLQNARCNVNERMEKFSWTDCVKNEELLRRVNEKRNILHTVKKKEG